MEDHRKFTLQWDKLIAIVKVGLPTAIQMVVVNTAYLLVTGMLNQFGTAVSAGSNVGLQSIPLLVCPVGLLDRQ